jgi:hypothetical protein
MVMLKIQHPSLKNLHPTNKTLLNTQLEWNTSIHLNTFHDASRKSSIYVWNSLDWYFAFRCLRLAIFALKLLCLLIPLQDS